MADKLTLETIQAGDKSSEFFNKLNNNFKALNDRTVYKNLTTNDFADGAVTNAKIADNAVTNAKIADGAITSDKIADKSITSDKIANGAITIGKLNQNVTDTLRSSGRIIISSSKPTTTANIIDVYGNSYSGKNAVKPGDIVIWVTSQDDQEG